MGTSHARNFSRDLNHKIVEEILQKKMANLSTGSGGFFPERIYLNTFLLEKNKANLLLYFLDPFVFYSDPSSNKNHPQLALETWNFSYLYSLYKYDASDETIMAYIQNNILLKWLFTKKRPHDLRGKYTRHLFYKHGKKFMRRAEPSEVSEMLQSWYGRCLNKKKFCADMKTTKEYLFSENLGYFNDLLVLLKESRIKTIMVIPPLLFRDPFKSTIISNIKRIALIDEFEVIDCSEVFLHDTDLFSNVDHLNNYGVQKFARDYMKPLLDGRTICRVI